MDILDKHFPHNDHDLAFPPPDGTSSGRFGSTDGALVDTTTQHVMLIVQLPTFCCFSRRETASSMRVAPLESGVHLRFWSPDSLLVLFGDIYFWVIKTNVYHHVERAFLTVCYIHSSDQCHSHLSSSYPPLLTDPLLIDLKHLQHPLHPRKETKYHTGA
jgi:hypothetical protein